MERNAWRSNRADISFMKTVSFPGFAIVIPVLWTEKLFSYKTITSKTSLDNDKRNIFLIIFMKYTNFKIVILYTVSLTAQFKIKATEKNA
jgi:hypothetical protein